MLSLNYTSRMSRAPSSAVVRVTGLDGADVEHSIMAASSAAQSQRGFSASKVQTQVDLRRPGMCGEQSEDGAGFFAQSPGGIR